MSSIEVRQMRSEDEAYVRECVAEFVRNEPISQSHQLDDVSAANLYMDTAFVPLIEDGVSSVAVDTTNGQVVGIRLAVIVRKGDPEGFPVPKDHPLTQKITRILRINMGVYEGIDLYEKYNVDELVNFRALGVSKKYQRQGIAGRLVEKTLELSKAKGIRLATVEASSAYSSKLFQNMGFEKLVEQSFDSLKVDGEPVIILEELREIHKAVSLYVKTI